MSITEAQITTEMKLSRIAFLSGKDREKEFSSLIHHLNVESLTECFHGLNGSRALGIDKISKAEYGINLNKNLEELVERMKRMAYRPGPVRQAFIPKEGKVGATRPLGISNLEDKIVQKMMQKILESIYEPLFLGCSYGFRPGIGCHDAIRDLHAHLFKNTVECVIDIDLENYFGSINHKVLEIILRDKIKDEKFMRYIIRMFKSGILTQGDVQINEEGVTQGSICSPVLANVFAHYVIDEWIERDVKPRCTGTVLLFRYADDGIICCQLESDAVRIMKVLGKRLAKYGLKLNEDKTKLVDFRKIEGKRAAFDFLGFTFYLGQSKTGRIIPKVKTIGKRMRVKLKRMNEWARSVRSVIRLEEIWETFCKKIRGHINYYGVSFNGRKVQQFVYRSTKIIYKWLNRRSQMRSFTWDKFNKFMESHPLPKVKIYHRLF